MECSLAEMYTDLIGGSGDLSPEAKEYIPLPAAVDDVGRQGSDRQLCSAVNCLIAAEEAYCIISSSLTDDDLLSSVAIFKKTAF